MFKNFVFSDLQIGQTARIQKTLTLNDIELFALASGDLNPAHLDAAYAQSTHFHSQIAHGMWGGALISALLGTVLPGIGTVYCAQQFQFLKPIKLGDTVQVSVTVLEKHAPHRVILKTAIENLSGDLITSGLAEVLAPLESRSWNTTVLPTVDLYHPGGLAQHYISQARNKGPLKVAIVHATTPYVIQGALDAQVAGLLEPIWIAPREKFEAACASLQVAISPNQLIETPHSHASAEQGVLLAQQGTVQALMKGSLHSSEFLQAVLAKPGLRTDKRISHVFVLEVPHRNTPLLITDGAINIAPDLMQKKDIVQNAIHLAHGLGITNPKVALLAAVETVESNMPATLDAAALCKMAERHQITGGILDGPLALDNAISSQAAQIKSLQSDVAGHADIWVVPNIESGNMLAKQMEYGGHAIMGGVVLGAQVPLMLSSRADPPISRVFSAAIARLMVSSD